MDTWIRTSEKAPTEADLPLWYWNTTSAAPQLLTDSLPGAGLWRSAKKDIPAAPTELLTIQEKDECAADEWVRKDAEQNAMRGTIYVGNPKSAFLAGIAYRDADIPAK